MATQVSTDFIRAASLAELEKKGCVVISGEDRPIVVFYHDGKVHAVDNRCPHIGFPLHKGTVSDGILTCHWHHARFDLTSGCTFDLFADDVPTCPVEIRDGEVWVGARCRSMDERGHGKRRLQEGMAQNIALIIAKSVLTLIKAGVDTRDIVRDGALFGARYRDGWASGMTILTAMANLVPVLPEEERFLALYQGLRRVAADCAGQVPRRDRYPLEEAAVPLNTLQRWLRYWTLVRHRDGAERTLLTALHDSTSPAEAATLLFTAATDRFYADGGHVLDFLNKALEVLDRLGAGREDPAHGRAAVGGGARRRGTQLLAPSDGPGAAAGTGLPAVARLVRGGPGQSVERGSPVSPGPAEGRPGPHCGSPGRGDLPGRAAHATEPGSGLRGRAADRPLRHGQRVRRLDHRPAHVHLLQRAAPGDEESDEG